MSKAEKAESGTAVELADFGREILRRRSACEAETGRSFDLPRNSVKRRTPGKLALLKAIEEAGGRW